MNIQEAKRRAENSRRMAEILAKLSKASNASAKKRAASELTRIGIESALKLAPAMNETELFGDFDSLSEDDFAKKYSGVLNVPIYERAPDRLIGVKHPDQVAAKKAQAATVNEQLKKEKTMINEGAGELSDEARELTLHADNDRFLHMSSHEPIMTNLRKKVKAGKYDPALAKKLWRYHADRAAQDYAKKHGDGTHWTKMFTPKHRDEAASHWEEMHRGELSEETITELSKATLNEMFGMKRRAQEKKDQAERDAAHKAHSEKTWSEAKKHFDDIMHRSHSAPVLVHFHGWDRDAKDLVNKTAADHGYHVHHADVSDGDNPNHPNGPGAKLSVLFGNRSFPSTAIVHKGKIIATGIHHSHSLFDKDEDKEDIAKHVGTANTSEKLHHIVQHHVNGKSPYDLMREETETPKQTPHTASKRNLNVERDIMEIMSQGRDVRQEARIAEAKRAGILREEKD